MKRRKDWAAATAKLHEAEEANPQQPYLYSQYGYIALETNKLDEAISDFRKELALYPTEDNVSSLLTTALLRQKRPDEAAAVLQAVLDRNPANESTVLRLAAIYGENNRLPDAAKTLRAGLAALPDNASIQSRLGIDLLRDGKSDEAVPLLKAVIASSNDPLLLNNSAYELANASLELPLAEKATRQALDLLDTASNNGETGRVALNRSNLLVETWDTLGWVLFREDKPAEAEPWVRAAWRNGNDAEPGYHFAVILEALHRPSEAREQIQLASAGGSASDSVKQLIQAKQKELHSDAVLKDSPTRALQSLRTYSLPRNGLKTTGEGFATVELELTPTGTAAVHLIEGDDTLKPLLPSVQQLNLNLPLPPGSHAKLLRRGILSCHTAPTCQLVLISTTDISTTDALKP